jgi:alpha-1,6-mannosyltransferase
LLSKTSRYRMILRMSRLREILLEERPDIIESGDPYQTAWKAIEFGRVLDSPVIGFYHSHFPEAYQRTMRKYLGKHGARLFRALARRYLKALYNRFDRTMVASPALVDLLRQWEVRNISRVDLGVNTGVFYPRKEGRLRQREALDLPTDRILLLYVGRLAGEKNLSTLLQTYRLLHQNEPERFHLVLIGDGLMRSQVEKLRERTGSVTWLSYCKDSNRLADYYSAADILVHPGLQETFGLVAVESQACGTPVIGIQGSYMDRIIFNDQQHWAHENTPAALEQAILRICRMDLQQLGAEASRAVLAHYSWESNFERIFDIYQATIEQKNHE